MARRGDFSKDVKRQAWDRAAGHCEATGTFYGLAPGQRCNMPLRSGAEYDHVILEAHSHDGSLENCACVCIPCHRWKTGKRDIPTAAKGVRQSDKHIGIDRPRGFGWPRKRSA